MWRVAQFEKCHYCGQWVNTSQGYYEERGHIFHKGTQTGGCLNHYHKQLEREREKIIASTANYPDTD